MGKLFAYWSDELLTRLFWPLIALLLDRFVCLLLVFASIRQLCMPTVVMVSPMAQCRHLVRLWARSDVVGTIEGECFVQRRQVRGCHRIEFHSSLDISLTGFLDSCSLLSAHSLFRLDESGRWGDKFRAIDDGFRDLNNCLKLAHHLSDKELDRRL